MSSLRLISFTRAVVPRCGQQLRATPRVRRSLYSANGFSVASRTVSLVNKYQARYQTTAAAAAKASTPIDSNSGYVFTNDKGEHVAFVVGGQVIPNIWLRDNCRCSTCVHDETQQRLLDTFDIPEDISIKDVKVSSNQVEVEWSDGHKSVYDPNFLEAATAPLEERAVIRQGLAESVLWGAEIKNNPPTVAWDDFKEDMDDYTRLDEAEKAKLTQVLKNIRTHGFTLISLPATPAATKSLLHLLGPIRTTHYGGFYDFTADLASKDTAYTNIALGAHTDTTYFTDPAGLQAFHLLEHTDEAGNPNDDGRLGGASLLVDGFKAAADLKSVDAEAYQILSEVPVHAHASGNAGISIQPAHGVPVLSHDAVTGALTQVRWNTSDRAGLGVPVSQTQRWYDAARKFDALLKSAQNEYWEQLVPGKMVVFDNWRVLHGRSAFEGKRRICGAYVSRDDWVSRWKMVGWGEGVVRGALGAS